MTDSNKSSSNGQQLTRSKEDLLTDKVILDAHIRKAKELIEKFEAAEYTDKEKAEKLREKFIEHCKVVVRSTRKHNFKVEL